MMAQQGEAGTPDEIENASNGHGHEHTNEADARLFARIISGTDATVLERAVNVALATIPLSARPQVQMIAPLGDRVRLYALITYVATEGDAIGAKRPAVSPRRLSVNYETLK